MDVKDKEGKLSKLDQKKLQQDIKTLTKKVKEPGPRARVVA